MFRVMTADARSWWPPNPIHVLSVAHPEITEPFYITAWPALQLLAPVPAWQTACCICLPSAINGRRRTFASGRALVIILPPSPTVLLTGAARHSALLIDTFKPCSSWGRFLCFASLAIRPQLLDSLSPLCFASLARIYSDRPISVSYHCLYNLISLHVVWGKGE
jgi:hypothetical protein